MRRLTPICIVGALALSGCLFEYDRGAGLSPGDVGGTALREPGEAAPYARVLPFGTGGVLRSDSDGDFRIVGLPAGAYALSISDDADGDGWPERAIGRAFAITSQQHADGIFGQAESTLTYVVMGDVLLDPVVEARGTVLIDGAAAPGALVYVSRSQALPAVTLEDGSSATELTVNTPADVPVSADGAGDFYFPALAAGELSFVAFWVDGSGNLFSTVPTVIDAEPGSSLTATDLTLALITPPGPRSVQLELHPEPESDVVIRLEREGVADADRDADDVFQTTVPASRSVNFLAPVGSWSVTVTSGVLSVSESTYIASIPGPELLTWSLVLSEGDPCERGDLRDCDGDGLQGLPVIAGWDEPAVADTWRPCADSCGSLFGEELAGASCEVGGETYDCDDDGDGQPDVTEHYACYGLYLGVDYDGDGLCSRSDPYPWCAQNDPDHPDCSADADNTSTPPPVRDEILSDIVVVDGGPQDAGFDAGFDGGDIGADAGGDAGDVVMLDGGDAGPIGMADGGPDGGVVAIDGGPMVDAGPQDAGPPSTSPPYDDGYVRPAGSLQVSGTGWIQRDTISVRFTELERSVDGALAVGVLTGPGNLGQACVESAASYPAQFVARFAKWGECVWMRTVSVAGTAVTLNSVVESGDGAIWVGGSLDGTATAQSGASGSVQIAAGSGERGILVRYSRDDGTVLYSSVLDTTGASRVRGVGSYPRTAPTEVVAVGEWSGDLDIDPANANAAFEATTAATQDAFVARIDSDGAAVELLTLNVTTTITIEDVTSTPEGSGETVGIVGHYTGVIRPSDPEHLLDDSLDGNAFMMDYEESSDWATIGIEGTTPAPLRISASGRARLFAVAGGFDSELFADRTSRAVPTNEDVFVLLIDGNADVFRQLFVNAATPGDIITATDVNMDDQGQIMLIGTHKRYGTVVDPQGITNRQLDSGGIIVAKSYVATWAEAAPDGFYLTPGTIQPSSATTFLTQVTNLPGNHEIIGGVFDNNEFGIQSGVNGEAFILEIEDNSARTLPPGEASVARFGLNAEAEIKEIVPLDDDAYMVIGTALAGTELGGLCDAHPGGDFIACFNVSGVCLWTREFGGGTVNVSDAVLLPTRGDVIVVGDLVGAASLGLDDQGSEVTLNSVANRSAFVARYTLDGRLLFADPISTTNSVSNLRVDAYDDESFIVAANFTDQVTFAPNGTPRIVNSTGAGLGNNDLAVARYNADHTVAWANALGADESGDGAGLYGANIVDDGSSQGAIIAFRVYGKPVSGAHRLDVADGVVGLVRMAGNTGGVQWSSQVNGVWLDMLPLAVSHDGQLLAVASDYGYGTEPFSLRDADGTVSVHSAANDLNSGLGAVAIYDAVTGNAVEVVPITSPDVSSSVLPWDLEFDSSGGLVLFGEVDQGGATFPGLSAIPLTLPWAGIRITGYVVHLIDEGNDTWVADWGQSVTWANVAIEHGTVLNDDSPVAGAEGRNNAYFGTLPGFVPWGQRRGLLWHLTTTGDSAP